MSKITDLTKTIVALSTALGTGSLAVIRIAGDESIAIVNKIFTGKNLLTAREKTIHFGKIMNGRNEVDQVVASIYKSPRSYTGEDVVEISCHANPLIVQQILDLLIKHGAHHAGPGEFTLRAFLNGKIDLTQAEAVSEIITAKTNRGLQNSISQLEGRLTGYLSGIKTDLITILGLMEIDLDFSEEDLDVVSKQDVINQIVQIQKKIERLLSSFNQGKLFNSTLKLVIAGEPNVGKSTLLNLLIGENRAITSQYPGTTRDTIHENVVIGNMFFRLIDTAGLRSTNDMIENEGIERSRTQIENADLVLYVVDASSVTGIDKTPKSDHAHKTIIVANKTDLGVSPKTKDSVDNTNLPVAYISATTGDGLEALKNKIVKKMSVSTKQTDDEVVISTERHKEILERSNAFLANAADTLISHKGFEFASVDVREALNALGEITGEMATDDILNNVFKNFCIGK